MKRTIGDTWYDGCMYCIMTYEGIKRYDTKEELDADEGKNELREDSMSIVPLLSKDSILYKRVDRLEKLFPKASLMELIEFAEYDGSELDKMSDTQVAEKFGDWITK